MEGYIYIFFLMVLVLLLASCVKYLHYNAPRKIKYVSIAALLLFCIRFLYLLSLFISNKLSVLYRLRYLYSLDYLYIPIIAAVSLYIMGRYEVLKFNHIIIGSAIITIYYIFFIVFTPSHMELNRFSWYVVKLDYSFYIYVFYLAISLLLLAWSISLALKGNSFLWGMACCLASMLFILENVITLLGGLKLPAPLLADLTWLVVFNTALSRLKR